MLKKAMRADIIKKGLQRGKIPLYNPEYESYP